MFINISFKTIRSLKSVLGRWHADHFSVSNTIKDQFFHSPQTLPANKVLKIILTGSLIFPALRPEGSQVDAYNPPLS